MSQSVKMKTKACSRESIIRGADMLGLSHSEAGKDIQVQLGGSWGNAKFSYDNKTELFETQFDSMRRDDAQRLLNAINIAEVEATMTSLGYQAVAVPGMDIIDSLRKNENIELSFTN